ncbi:hypothetical protein ACHQM5_010730 [Ranunculus cassubicifolius]
MQPPRQPRLDIYFKLLPCFMYTRNFEQQWLSITFSMAIFFGNGLVAILAGLFGNVLADTLGFGPVAPFDAAAVFLAIGMAIILSSWNENFGDPSESKDLLTQFKGAAIAIASDEKIALLGAIQSLFEGSMYTFVFLWTPALSPNDEDIPHGFIFATFMLSSMLGSSLASRLLARATIKVESYMQVVFAVSAGTFNLLSFSLSGICSYGGTVRSTRSRLSPGIFILCAIHLLLMYVLQFHWLLAVKMPQLDRAYSSYLQLDLSEVEPCISGPKRYVY